MEHGVAWTRPLRYPGGKDGFYYSRCHCGRQFGPTAQAHHAEQRCKHHARDLNEQEAKRAEP